MQPFPSFEGHQYALKQGVRNTTSGSLTLDRTVPHQLLETLSIRQKDREGKMNSPMSFNLSFVL